MAFNARNLSYDRKEPTFLRKLKSQYATGDGDYNGYRQVRARKMKSSSDDDEPTYVDEFSHEIVSQSDYKRMLDNNQSVDHANDEHDKELGKSLSEEPVPSSNAITVTTINTASIGATKKRKHGRIIGETASMSEPEPETGYVSTQTKVKHKQKNKKIKLSFDDAP